jgi:PKD repeat protein
MFIRLIKSVLFSTLLIICFLPASAQYAVNGNASQISCNCYQLTPDAGGQSGSVWNLNQIDLSTAFDFYFDVFLGCNDGGADGIVFVLQPVSTTVGGSGGGLGYAGITPSLGVEIDTYQNGWDPGADHIAILQNGDVNHGSGNNLAGPVGVGNLENCVYHVLRITWNPATNAFNVYLDGSLIATYNGDIINTIFGGNPNVYWGFTAGTGGAQNDQRFCVAINPVILIAPSNNCLGLPTHFNDQSYSPIGPITSWLWDFGDGTTSTLQNPDHTYLAAGTYTISLTVTDINGCSEAATTSVTIFAAPTANAGADDDFCAGSNVTLAGSGGGSYQWSPNTGLSDAFISNPVANPASATTYTLTVTDANGCQDTDDLTVTVNPLPVAAFAANDECFGTAVQFTDQSSVASGSIIQWNWDFDDGTTSNQQNPSHLYAASGTYNVSLSVTTNTNCAGSTNVQVTVFAQPTADFTFTNQCDGTAVPFTDQSSGGAIAQWGWDFGDGAQSLNQNPSQLYSAAGTYTVTLGIVSNQGCTATVSQQITVYPNPVADFTAPDVCFGTQTDFTDISSVSSGTIDVWSWDFADGNTSNLQTPSNNYAVAGTYSVSLMVTTNNQCTATQTHAVNVNAIPVADFNFNNVCRDASAVFVEASSISAGVINSWNWDFGDGAISNQQSPSHNYATAGTYTVSLNISSGVGCNDQIQQDITIYPVPVAAYINTTACEGYATDFTDQSTVTTATITNWLWSFGDGNTSNQQNPSYTFTAFGNFNTMLTVTSSDGCINSLTQAVTVYASPIPDFTAMDVCHTTGTIFTNTSTIGQGSITVNDWAFGDGTTSNQTSPSYIYALPGTYTVSLTTTTDNGCTESITKPAVVFPNPVVDFQITPDAGCMPLQVAFSDLSSIVSGNLVSWTWNIEGAGMINEQNTTQVFPNAGLYDVTLTAISDEGCSTTLTRSNYLTVHPKPFPSFTFTPQITEILYPEISFTDLSSGAPTQWNWDFGTGDVANEQNPVYSYPDTGVFTVELVVFNQFGCSDTVTHTVIITPSFTIYVPSAFTPDGDGLNDVFIPLGIGWRDYELRVFSRSGTQVFESFDPTVGWNGKVRESQDYTISDVYVWRVYIRDKNNRMQDFVGTVTLIR